MTCAASAPWIFRDAADVFGSGAVNLQRQQLIEGGVAEACIPNFLNGVGSKTVNAHGDGLIAIELIAEGGHFVPIVFIYPVNAEGDHLVDGGLLFLALHLGDVFRCNAVNLHGQKLIDGGRVSFSANPANVVGTDAVDFQGNHLVHGQVMVASLVHLIHETGAFMGAGGLCFLRRGRHDVRSIDMERRRCINS